MVLGLRCRRGIPLRRLWCGGVALAARGDGHGQFQLACDQAAEERQDRTADGAVDRAMGADGDDRQGTAARDAAAAVATGGPGLCLVVGIGPNLGVGGLMSPEPVLGQHPVVRAVVADLVRLVDDQHVQPWVLDCTALDHQLDARLDPVQDFTCSFAQFLAHVAFGHELTSKRSAGLLQALLDVEKLDIF